MNRAHRHATGTPQLSPLIAGAVGLGVLIVIIGDAAAQLGARLDRHRPPPVAPLSLALELADGKTRWPAAAAAIAAAAGGILVLTAAALFTWRWRTGSRRTHADRAAPMMGRGRDIHPVSRANARATAKRLSIVHEGLPIARAVGSNQPLLATWEDQQCDIWGPRRGKTATRAIPTLLAAPGAAFATSRASHIGVNVETVRRAIRSGELRVAARIGRSPRLSREAIDSWLARTTEMTEAGQRRLPRRRQSSVLHEHSLRAAFKSER